METRLGTLKYFEAASTSPWRSSSDQPRMTRFSAAVTGPASGASGVADGVAEGVGALLCTRGVFKLQPVRL